MYDKAPKFDAKNFHYHNDGTGRYLFFKYPQEINMLR